MASDDRNSEFTNLTVTDSLTDPGGTEHTGSIDGGSGGGGDLTLENTDGTALMSTATLQAGTDLQFSDDGDGTATLDFTGSGGTDTRVDVENTDGTPLVSDVVAIHAGTNLSFTDDGDDTVTLDASVNTFSGDHADLTNVSSDQHHAKTTSASDLTDVSADSVSDAHHAKYTDSEAVSAVNNDTDHGSTASHDYFSGSHTDLSDVASDDHHAKYTDEDAQDATNALLTEGENVTLSYDDAGDSLTIAATDTDTNTHFDAENSDGTTLVADVQAVQAGTDLSFTDDGDDTVTLDFTGSGGSDTRVDVENTDGTPLVSDVQAIHAGTDLSFTDDGDDTVTLDASVNTFSGDHADLTNVSSDDHHTKYTDSEAVSAVNNDPDHGSTASHDYFSGDHADLTNVSSDQHHAQTHDNADHSTPMIEDGINNADSPYEIQKNGTDGAGVINFITE